MLSSLMHVGMSEFLYLAVDGCLKGNRWKITDYLLFKSSFLVYLVPQSESDFFLMVIIFST